MAGYAVGDLLAPMVVKRTISRLNLPGTALSQLFGWNIGNGPVPGAVFLDGNEGEGGTSQRGNTEDNAIRTGQYDIFDHTRQIAGASSPGTSATRVKPQKVGFVQYTIPRSAERMTLKYEDLNNMRKIGSSADQVDSRGRRYILMQERYLAARYANLIEFQTAAMIRGSYSFTEYGDRLAHSFSGGSITIDYKRPAGNLGKLEMGTGSSIISADWDSASTDIPDQLYRINDAMIQQCGQGLKHVILTSRGWNYLLNNTKIITQGGSSRAAFEELARKSYGQFVGILRNLPWVTFHIVDYSLEVETSEGTFTNTKLIGDDYAAFLPEINDTWAVYIRGGEEVVEGPNGAQSFQYGAYPYSYPEYDPAGHNLCMVHNGFPANPVPKAIAYGKIKGVV